MKIFTKLLSSLLFLCSFGECIQCYIFHLWVLDKHLIEAKIALYIRTFISSAFKDAFSGLVCIFYCNVCLEMRQCLLEYRRIFNNILRINDESDTSRNIFFKLHIYFSNNVLNYNIQYQYFHLWLFFFFKVQVRGLLDHRF